MRALGDYFSERGQSTSPVHLIFFFCIAMTSCATYQIVDMTPTSTERWLADNLVEGYSLANNRFVRFEWQLRETDLRVQGQGVARLGVPDKARVDLFLENGEGVLAAALVGGEIRVGQDQSYLGVIPSPPLLWASLGLFRPGKDAVLVSSNRLGNDRVRLAYSISNGFQISYDLLEGFIERVQLIEDGQTVHVVDLEIDAPERLPLKATYRNVVSYRELVIDLKTANGVGSYDESIWHPEY